LVFSSCIILSFFFYYSYKYLMRLHVGGCKCLLFNYVSFIIYILSGSWFNLYYYDLTLVVHNLISVMFMKKYNGLIFIKHGMYLSAYCMLWSINNIFIVLKREKSHYTSESILKIWLEPSQNWSLFIKFDFNSILINEITWHEGTCKCKWKVQEIISQV
jgi:hypothetical protein